MIKSRGKLETVTVGADRLRLGPWRGQAEIAHIAPPAGHVVDEVAVTECVALLSDRGYRSIITAALGPEEQEPFLRRGFTCTEQLELLRHDLGVVPETRSVHIRRARRSDHNAVLALDHLAFDPFWRLDHRGLEEARGATPINRFRVVDINGVTGYAICGKSGAMGYLQRLAVHPAAQGEGIGAALVEDALWWMRRRHGSGVLVNTQSNNRAALAMYHHMGFVDAPGGLAVLTLDLTDGTVP